MNDTRGDIHDFNYQAALLDHTFNWVCVAVILSQTKLVTQAHCTHDKKKDEMHIRAGTRDPTRGGIVMSCLFIVEHEEFDPKTYANDIAVIELRRDRFQYGPTIGSVVLPQSALDELGTGTNVTVSLVQLGKCVQSIL